jgi:hypothetical protein
MAQHRVLHLQSTRGRAAGDQSEQPAQEQVDDE